MGEQVWSRLVAARRSLERAVSAAYDEVLVDVSERVSASGSIGKSDIGALVLWERIQANTKWAASLTSMPDTEVRAVTRQAVDAVRDLNVAMSEAAGQGRRLLAALAGFTTGTRLPRRCSWLRHRTVCRLRPMGTRRTDHARRASDIRTRPVQPLHGLDREVPQQGTSARPGMARPGRRPGPLPAWQIPLNLTRSAPEEGVAISATAGSLGPGLATSRPR